MTEIYRPHDGRWSIERALDRYLIYDTARGDGQEVWSCATLVQLYAWMAGRGLAVDDFEETA